jgi:hypothetical protein
MMHFYPSFHSCIKSAWLARMDYQDYQHHDQGHNEIEAESEENDESILDFITLGVMKVDMTSDVTLMVIQIPGSHVPRELTLPVKCITSENATTAETQTTD